MPLQSIEPRRLYRQIAEQLRGLIRGGFAHSVAVERWALLEMAVGEGVLHTLRSIFLPPLSERV